MPCLRHVFGSYLLAVKHIGELRHHQVLQTLLRRQGSTGLRQLRGQVGGGHGDPRIGIGDVVLELFSPVHGVDGHHHRIDAQNSKVCDHQLGAVLHVEHHAVSGLHAQSFELPCQLLRMGHQLPVSPDPTHEHQGRFFGVTQGTDGQVHPK